MKNPILNKNYWKILTFLGLIIFAMQFTSCTNNDSTGGVITVNKVFLENVNSPVRDREVTFARLSQTMRIEGSGFTNLKKVYINGFSTYFNVVYVTDTSFIINIDKNTPLLDAAPGTRNTIRLVNDNFETTFQFEIRAAAPSITNISHTLPKVGELITVYGSGLTEVSKVTFPGNVEVATGITSDKEGKFFTVTMPSGVSEDGGSLFVKCSNGGVYSPAYFNFKKGVLLNFDGAGAQGFWTTDGMIKPADLESTTFGIPHVSQGLYVPHRPSRVTSFAAGKNRCSEVWTSGNESWRTQLTPFIPATTTLDKVALQFDIYVPNEWKDTGFLKICLSNGFNGGEWAGACYNYVPWIVGDKVTPFQTTGWTTVTIPLNKIYAYSDATKNFTFETILAYREAANYKNFGLFFENSDMKLQNVTGNTSEIQFASKATSVSVYTDNWRIVSLKTPVYDDFSN